MNLQNPPLIRRTLRHALLVGAGALLAACAAVGPDYRVPEPDTAGPWTQPVPDTFVAGELSAWWRSLEDPVLERLVETALDGNLDLRQALARIDEARAMRDRTAGALQPVVGTGASVGRQRISENGSLPIGSIPGLDATQSVHDLGFDASWEIDLFGGQRRALESADARLAETWLEAEGVRMRVAAEVARTWYEASGAARELLARQGTVRTLEETLRLTHQRHAAGDASRAEVDTIEAQLAIAYAGLPEIEARQRASTLALGVLLGQGPDAELSVLDTLPDAPQLLPLPVGARADILRRRPDVLAAERRLAASTADIGVATAELFPKLTIGAGGGFQALDAGDWFQSSSTRFSVVPFLSWRVFDGGRVRAEIRAREAAAQRTALAYEQVVLTALSDAERALGDYRAGLESLARRDMALAANLRSHAHARARYHAGDIALVELLATERLLHEARQTQAQAQTSAGIRLVALYKALGGGWKAPNEEQVATTDPVYSKR